jgi:hypothetical protein
MKWFLGASILIAIAMGRAATATIPAATASIDDASLRFLPPDTQSVAVIDVAALRNSPLMQDVFNRKDLLPVHWAVIMAGTGFDPQRDLDKVTVAKIGTRDSLAVVQARFDKFKVEQYLKDHVRSEVEVYLGQTLYREGESAYVLFDNTALGGQASAVKKAIDQMQLPGSRPLHSDLIAAIQTIEAGNQVWAAGNLSVNDLSNVGVRGPAPALEMLKSLRNGTYQMRVDSGIHARGVGNFADAESAKNVSDLARGAIAIAKSQVAKSQPELLQALDGIEVTNSGATLTVRVEESGDLLKKLKDLKPTIERNFR